MHIHRHTLALILAISLLTISFITPYSPVKATSITVNTASDLPPDSSDGLCSLRAAIAVAQANSNAADTNCVTGLANEIDVIQIDPSLAGQTLTLSYNLPNVPAFDTITQVSSSEENRIEIIGPTTNRTDFVIDGANRSRIFHVGYVGFGNTDYRGYLKLTNLTIRGGNGISTNPMFVNNRGGAIFLGDGSELTLDNVELRDNHVSAASGNAWGGAIYGSTARIINNGGAYINNSATSSGINGRGGAVFLENQLSAAFSASLEGYAVRFQGNSASHGGGVIAINPGVGASAITLQRILAAGNSAANGGVVYVETPTSVTISDSTLSGNSALASGGVVMATTTSASFNFFRDTFYNNTATSGGLYYASIVGIYNSIIYGSTCFRTGAASLSGSRNLSGGAIGAGCNDHNLLGTITGFDTTLQQNGGSQVLETHRLMAGSNAIDNGDAGYCGAIDQRSIPRSANGTGAINAPQPGDCDIGAYEYAPYVINFVTGSSTITEGNLNHQVGVQLTIPDTADSPLAADLPVTAAIDPSSTATNGTDFSLDSATVSFPAGSASGTVINFSVDSIDDFIAEQTAETVILNISAPGAAVAEPRQHTVSIQDNDVPGIMVDDLGGISVSENTPAVSDNFRIRLESQPDFNASVLVKIQPDKHCGVNNAGRGQEYQLTIANADWQQWHDVTVQPYDDWTDDDDEDETVPHDCVITYDFDSDDPVYNNTFDTLYVDVYDNDVAGVNFVESGDSTAIAEGGATDTYTIALNSQPDTAANVVTTIYADPDDQCSVNGGAPGAEVAVAIFSSPTSTLPFNDWIKADWETPQTVTVTANDDPTVEPDGAPAHQCVITHRVASSDARYQALNNASHPHTIANSIITASITDNDPPFIDITAGTVRVNEATPATADTYTVVLYRQPLDNVTVNISVPSAAPVGNQILINSVDDSATAATTLALTFAPADWNTPQTVYVFAVNDDYDEDKPHFSQVTHTITSTAYGFSDSAKRRFFLDDPTKSGSGSLNTIDVPVTIDDDDISEVQDTPTSLAVTEGGATASYAIRLMTHPYADVTVRATPTSVQCDIGAGAGVAVDVVIAADTWNTPQTATVTAVNDDLVEASPHTCTITHTVSSADGKYAALLPNTQYGPDDVTVSITDDDLPNILINTAGGLTVNEATPTTADSYTVVLENQPGADVTIDLFVPSIAPVGNQIMLNSVNDPVMVKSSLPITFTNANWNVAQTVYVFAVDDAFDETDPHTSQINHSVTSSATGFATAPAFNVDAGVPSPNTVSMPVTIGDNDTAAVQVAESGTTDVSEDGTQDTYTILLGSIPFDTVTVTVDTDPQCSINGGAPGAAADVTIAPANWNNPQTVTVGAYDDTLVEGTHTCVITHAVSSADPDYAALDGPILNGPANVTASITDNDNPEIAITTSGGVAVDEATPATADTYDVVLLRQPQSDVTITLAVPVDATIGSEQVLVNTVNNSGTAAGTLSLTFTSANWNVAQTVYVFAVDDPVDEATSHTSQMNHSVTSAAYGYSTAPVFIVDGGTPSPNTVSVPMTITDNDASSVLVAPTAVNIAEGGAGSSYNMQLGSRPQADVIVTVDPDSQCGVNGGLPGAAATITMIPANWNTPQLVTVLADDDSVIEGGHTCLITHTTASTDAAYNGLGSADANGPADVTAAITDNDEPRVLVNTAGGLTLDEATPAIVDTYQVVLERAPDADVNVVLSVASGQALVSSGGAPGAALTLTFTSTTWNIAQTVAVAVIDDAVDEANPHLEQIIHSVTSTATGYGTAPVFVVDGGAPSLNTVSVPVTIADNDSAGMTLTESAGTTTVTEGGTMDTYTIRLNSAPLVNTVVTIAPDTQCSVNPATVTFTPADWNADQTITVTAVDDPTVEGAHSCTITHTADGNYGSLAGGNITAAITDNDSAGVSITAVNLTLNEAAPAATASFTVVLDSQPLADVSIQISISDGQTTIGGATTATLTFTYANWNVPQTVTVSVVDDAITEPNPHTGTIGHSVTSTALGYDSNPPVRVNGVAGSDVTVSITDNDVARISLVQSDGSTAVTEGGITDSYTIVLNTQPSADVIVVATPDAQCISPAVTLTFTSANWNLPQTVNVAAVDDAVAEGTHNCAFTHTVSSADTNYGSVVIPQVTVTITDNDTADVPVMQTGGTTDIYEQGTTSDTYDMRLNSQPTQPVTISVIFNGQCSAAPVTLTFDDTNWNAPQTVTVTAIDDGIIEPSPHTCAVQNSAASADAQYQGRTASVNVNVFDNDGANLTWTETGGSTQVDETGPTSDSYDLQLAVIPTAVVTVSITTDGQCSAALSTVTFDDTTWNIVQTITVTAVDDTADEPSPHPCIITHTATSTDTRYNLARILSAGVLDNDLVDLAITESGGNTQVSEAQPTTADSYELTLPTAPASDITVTITSDAQCAVQPPTTYTFTPADWNNPQTVSVIAIDDALPETSPHLCAVTHTLSDTVAGTVIGTLILNVQVMDNDAAAMLAAHTGSDTRVAEQNTTTDDVQLQLASAPTGSVSITVGTDGQCEIVSPALPLIFMLANYNVAQPVTISAIDDVVVESSPHSCFLTLSSFSTDPAYSGLTTTFEVLVMDNDGGSAASSDISNTSASQPNISIFDPAISKLGFLKQGELGLKGERLEWVITVANTGQADGINVIITDTLRPELRIEVVNTSMGAVQTQGQTVIVTIPRLAPGETAIISIVTTVLEGGTLDNTACIKADNLSTPRCATASPVEALPTTGETPWYRPWFIGLVAALLAVGIGGYAVKRLSQLFLSYRNRSNA